MAVRFIVGRAGSDKTAYCFRAAVEMMRAQPLGQPIYWIVPKQETFTTERQLTCASGLDGFCRARIVSFELLGQEILSECGGTAIPDVTQLGRQMILGLLLRRHEQELVYYKSAARQIGLAAELDATFAELERCGKSAPDLLEMTRQLEAAGDAVSLVPKLNDLRFLYEKYLAYLGQERLDPHRRLAQVLASLEGCQRLSGATVFVDGFLEFTEYERRILAGLAKVCGELQITLMLDPKSPLLADPHRMPDELGLFHRTEDAYRRLWFAFNEAGIAPERPVVLEKIHRFRNPALSQIEQSLFAEKGATPQSSEHIELIEAADRRGEVDAAARQIRKWLADGLRLRDVAVLMRTADDYHELIDASFNGHDIPYFVDRRRSAAHHPVLQFIRSVLQIALRQWPHDAVMTLLKSGLSGISDNDADALENYVLLHRIHGPIWADPAPWTFQRRLTRGHDEETALFAAIETKRMDALRRRLADRIASLSRLFAGKPRLTVRAITIELFKVAEQFGVRATLRGWIDEAAKSSRLVETGEHEQVWSELIRLLDEMVDLLGDEEVAPENYLEILETGLESFDLALPPAAIDQVIVGTVDRTRKLRARAVIVLGMNDNQFPKSPDESSIISDSERRTLRQHRVELDRDSQRSTLDEELLGYIAMTRASERLCLTRAVADDESRPQAPSPYWTRLRGQFPALKPVEFDHESSLTLEGIGTPRQLVTALMSWVRQPKLAASAPYAALYQWLASHECSSDAIDTMRYRAWKALSYVNDAKLSKETAALMFKSPLTASVSRIETFATCPFKHFVRYGLQLTEREDDQVTPLDLGNVCHGILERIVREMLQRKAGWEASSPQLIRQISAEIGKDLRGELMLSSARNKYILDRIERTIADVVAAQSAAGKRGRLVPWRAELQFGDGTKLGPLVLKTPGGGELRLRGRIDRVDRVENEAEFAVIDYKYRGSTLTLDWVYHGLSLQLLTYVLVIQKNGSELAKQKFRPVAALYVKLLRRLERQKHPDDALSPKDPNFHLADQPRGLIDASQRHLIDSNHVSQWSDVVKVFVKGDGTLGNRHASDGCETAEFAAMLRLAERKLAEMGDGILSGQIDVAPYRLGLATPCEHCEYRPVCRFDASINRYHQLGPMKREEVLQRAVEEAQG